MFPLLALKLAFSGAVAKAKGAWTAMPPKVRLGLLIAVAALLGLLLHQHVAHKRLKAADAAGYARAVAEDAKVIAAMRARAQTAEANGLRISQEVRTRHDEEVHANAVAAAAVFVRGSGAASCRPVRDSSLPARASGNGTGNGQTDAAVAQVPSGERIDLFGLPVDGAVAFGQQNDDLISEVKAWHDWYTRQAAEWEKLRAKP